MDKGHCQVQRGGFGSGSDQNGGFLQRSELFIISERPLLKRAGRFTAAWTVLQFGLCGCCSHATWNVIGVSVPKSIGGPLVANVTALHDSALRSHFGSVCRIGYGLESNALEWIVLTSFVWTTRDEHDRH